MAFDVIVFSQKELDSALSAGNKSICLCDGVFLLPDTKDVTYTSIGNVKILSAPSASVSSYISSYTTSYVTSYVMSYVTSYKYEYEFTSSGSYVTSYVTSFVTSFSSIEHGEESILVNGYGINLI